MRDEYSNDVEAAAYLAAEAPAWDDRPSAAEYVEHEDDPTGILRHPNLVDRRVRRAER